MDKHALNFQHHHTTEKKVLKKAETDRSLTKLKVGNVAFEATEKDLRQLFSPFGQVSTISFLEYLIYIIEYELRS